MQQMIGVQSDDYILCIIFGRIMYNNIGTNVKCNFKLHKGLENTHHTVQKVGCFLLSLSLIWTHVNLYLSLCSRNYRKHIALFSWNSVVSIKKFSKDTVQRLNTQRQE